MKLTLFKSSRRLFSFIGILISFYCTQVFAQSGLTFDWANKIGGTGNEIVRDIKFSDSGFFYITGNFQQTVDFDPGADVSNLVATSGNDIFLAKYTSAGNLVWAFKIGGTGDDIGRGIAIGQNDTVIVVGHFSNTNVDFDPGSGTALLSASSNADGFVAKYAPDGAFVWARSLSGTANQFVYDVDIAADQSIVLCGETSNTITFNGSSPGTSFSANILSAPDPFFAKYSRNGEPTLGLVIRIGGGGDYAQAVKIDANNDIYLSGAFTTTADFDFNNTTDLTSQSSNNADGFLAKYTSSGAYLWAKRVYSNNNSTVGNNDIVADIALASGGGVYIAGQYYGVGIFETLQYTSTNTNATGFLAKYASNGTPDWVRPFIGSTDAQTRMRGINTDDSGNLYGVGVINGNGTVDFDGSANTFSQSIGNGNSPRLFIIKYSNSGDFNWVNTFGTNPIESFALDIDNSNSLYLGGYYNIAGNVDFDFGSGVQNLSASTGEDIFLAKYSQCSVPDNPTVINSVRDTICTDENTVVLTTPLVPNATSYQWTLAPLWTGTSTTNQITVNRGTATATNNTFSVRAVNACGVSVLSASKTITRVDRPTVGTAINGNSSVCQNGNISFTVTGMSFGNNWVWNLPQGVNIVTQNYATRTITLQFTNAGSIDIEVANANGCDTSAFISKTITVNPAPNAAISGPGISCNSALVTLTASGGNTYQWNNGLGTGAVKTFSPLGTNTFSVTVTDASGCTATASQLVTVVSNPTASITPASASICAGESILLTASGGNSYAWSNSGGSNAQATFSPASTTTYTVTVTDANGCTNTASRQVTVNAAPNASITPSTASVCTGESITLTASGGTSYAWSNSGGNNAAATFSPATNTTYTVTVTGTGGCTATASQLVTVNAIPTASISPATAIICSGGNINLTASGGNSYAWSNGGSNNATANFAPTTNTTYTVTVTGTGGCTATASRLVTVNATPVAAITPTTVTICNGESTTLTASGGNSYAWSNGGGNNAAATFSPTTNTTYTVTVTGAGGCTATASRLVTVNATPVAAITPATVSICNGESATLTASGGGTYAWSNGGGSNAAATFSPTTNTTYTVTVTSANNCTASASRLVTVNTNPTATISPSSASICDGESTVLTASGGGTYAWSNTPGNGPSISVSPNQTTSYSVTVTAANSCTATASATITVNPIPNAAINGPTTICSGLSATLTAGGGNSYAWSNGGTTTAITVSPTSTTTYTVTVTGTGNCTASASQTISVQSAPTATISGNTTICNGESTTLTANGGNTYEWSNGATSASIIVSPTSNTTYTVTVSIGANCTASESITVTVNQPSALTQLTETICQGSSYTFDGNTLTQANTYTATFTNAAGCDSTVELTLNVTPANVTRLDTTVCDGATINFFSQTITQGGLYTETLQTTAGCDSIVELNVTYLNPIATTVNAQICNGQTYEFDGQQLNQSNTYTATFTSTQGCDSTVTLNLNVVSEITETVNASICDGDSYAFDGQQLTIADTYTATFLSAGGCDSVVTLNLTVNPLPQPTVTANNADLSTETFATYQWQLNGNDIQGADQQTYTATQNGDYSVVVTDANGCENTSNAVNVTVVSVANYDLGFAVYPNPTTGIINIETAINNAEINIISLEGKVVFSKKATTNNTTIDITALAHGMYIIEVKAENSISRVRVVKE